MDGVSPSKGKCLYENDNNFEPNQKDEEDLLNSKEIFNDISQNLTKEKGEENKTKFPIFQQRKESTQITEKTVHETSTKFKTELTVNEDEKEIYAEIKKLKKLIVESKDVGNRTNQIISRIKNNSLNAAQKIAFEMFKTTDYYKCTKKNFTKVGNSSYKTEDSTKNLLFIQKTFKEVLSEKKENEEIIRVIMSNSDYPILIKLLNMTIEKIITIYSDKCDSSEFEDEANLLFLKDAFKKLKDKMETEGKSSLYVKSFNYFAGHIKYVFKSINEHRKNKSNL